MKFNKGTYHVYAKGHNGNLPMKVQLSEDKIVSIEVDDSGESEGIANPVFERLPQDIINGQTLNVDVISGATVTSEGIVQALQMQLNKQAKIQIFYEHVLNQSFSGLMRSLKRRLT